MRRCTKHCLAAIALTLGLLGPTAASARASQALGDLTLETLVDQPWSTDLAWRTGDDGIYLVEQHGRVQRLAGDESRTVLDISDETHAEYEMGLLGLVFSPSGSHAYVNYIANDDFRTVVEEFPVGDDGTLVVDGRRIVIEIGQPETNHNGGHLAFGPDGMLYIGMGDGGGFADPSRTAQDRDLLLGKLLRIDPTTEDRAPGYTVPPDNPYVDDGATRPEIWALGLRNPWRFTFDSQSGDLWVADVGEGAAEEVNAVAAIDGRDAGRGGNFGWSAFEGSGVFNGGLDDSEHTAPIFEYSHDGGRCSISGGAVARGAEAGSLDGWYVFGDYCTGELFALRPERVTDGGDGAAQIQAVDVVTLPITVDRARGVVASPEGAIYVLGETDVSRLAG